MCWEIEEYFKGCNHTSGHKEVVYCQFAREAGQPCVDDAGNLLIETELVPRNGICEVCLQAQHLRPLEGDAMNQDEPEGHITGNHDQKERDRSHQPQSRLGSSTSPERRYTEDASSSIRTDPRVPAAGEQSSYYASAPPSSVEVSQPQQASSQPLNHALATPSSTESSQPRQASSKKGALSSSGSIVREFIRASGTSSKPPDLQRTLEFSEKHPKIFAGAEKAAKIVTKGDHVPLYKRIAIQKHAENSKAEQAMQDEKARQDEQAIQDVYPYGWSPGSELYGSRQSRLPQQPVPDNGVGPSQPTPLQERQAASSALSNIRPSGRSQSDTSHSQLRPTAQASNSNQQPDSSISRRLSKVIHKFSGDGTTQHTAKDANDRELKLARRKASQAEERIFKEETEMALARSRAQGEEEEGRLLRAATIASLQQYTDHLHDRVGKVGNIWVKYIQCGHKERVDRNRVDDSGLQHDGCFVMRGPCDDCYISGMSYLGDSKVQPSRPVSVPASGSSNKTGQRGVHHIRRKSVAGSEGSGGSSSSRLTAENLKKVEEEQQRQYYQPSESPSAMVAGFKARPLFAGSEPPSRLGLNPIREDDEPSVVTAGVPYQAALRYRELEEANRQRLFKRFPRSEDADEKSVSSRQMLQPEHYQHSGKGKERTR